MPRMNRHVCILLVSLVLALTACEAKDDGKPSTGATDTAGSGAKPAEPGPAAPATPKTYPATADGLKQQLTDVMAGDAAALADIALPDPKAWFAAHFPARADALVAEHGNIPPAAFAALPAKLKAEGRSALHVECFSAPTDMGANGYQQEALKASAVKTELCSMRATLPGETSGFHLFNFVVVNGKWRFAGKMKNAAREPPTDPQMDAISELRARDREEFFKSGKLPE